MRKRNLFSILSIFVSFFSILSGTATYAQSCTANAGGNAVVCGSTTTLTGSVSGTLGAGTPTWTFVSGPTVPTIQSPNTLITGVTNMIIDGNYTFQLSRECLTGTAVSTVTITAHPRPVSFTAGPDQVNICATLGTATLAGVIPAGFTGSWSAVNIFNYQNFGTVVTTNSSFDNNIIANPVFSLINKANHDIDPAYYAILTITSNDGICTYRDTAVVRFCPNPALSVSNTTKCIDAVSSQFFDFVSGPNFNSGTSGSAGAAVNGTTITLNVSSQPAGGNITFDRISGRRIYVTGAGVLGTYTFTITVSNCCGTVTSPSMTFTVTGINNHLVNFQPTGHGAPEQLALYNGGGTGGEVHCGIAGTSTPELFYFDIDPSDDPATTITTVISSGILPPGASTPILTQTGAGTANRSVSVDPGASGWKAGTYKFTLQVGSAPCFRSQSYYIHISDNSRLPLFVPDTVACYPGTGSVTATIRLPEVYQEKVNSSYFQGFSGYYNFQVVSKPPGSATPTYTASNLRSITQTQTTISNLDKAGDYVFRIIPFSGNGAGPFLEQEYACSGFPGPLFYDFTIKLEEIINSNAGSGQTGICAQTVNLLGNSPGVGNGKWTVISAPAGATPIFSAPLSPSTQAINLNEAGEYKFAWTIITPLGACETQDIVTFNVICALPVGLSQFTANKEGTAVSLQWVTTTEQNNKGFEIQRSDDGVNFTIIGTLNSQSRDGVSNTKIQYNFIDKAPLKGTNFYRLKQIDLDGQYNFSEVKTTNFGNPKSVTIAPNPVINEIRIQGLSCISSVTIAEVSGRVVLKTNTKHSSADKIDVSRLAPGFYYISITDEKEITTIYKVLKK